MSKLQERLNHIGELVRGLSEQTSGNITIINSNCQMLGNRLEEIEKKVQELETKTASDLSQTVVAESATSKEKGGYPEIPEDQNCVWVARDKDGDLFVHSFIPILGVGVYESNEDSFLIYDDRFPQVTYENSPQKLVLESSIISKTETVGKDVLDKLRAKLEAYEKNANEGKLQQFDDGMLFVIKKIREVIE